MNTFDWKFNKYLKKTALIVVPYFVVLLFGSFNGFAKSTLKSPLRINGNVWWVYLKGADPALVRISRFSWMNSIIIYALIIIIITINCPFSAVHFAIHEIHVIVNYEVQPTSICEVTIVDISVIFKYNLQLGN